MKRSTYLRPVGRVTISTAGVGAESVLRIGGSDGPVFCSAEILQRRPGGSVTRQLVSVADLRAAAAQDDASGAEMRSALCGFARPRAPVAGLASDRPLVMGIVNVTPDSFSDGGSFASAREAIAHARRLADEGADILDIGGESTRPGSDPVPLEEELRRVLPVLEGLAGTVAARLSVDTRKAAVMRRAAEAGAHVINDVSALSTIPRAWMWRRRAGSRSC